MGEINVSECVPKLVGVLSAFFFSFFSLGHKPTQGGPKLWGGEITHEKISKTVRLKFIRPHTIHSRFFVAAYALTDARNFAKQYTHSKEIRGIATKGLARGRDG